MKDYGMILNARVQGIPCKVGVVHVHVTHGSYSHNAASDIDYYGETDYEYDILDRGGRLAPWLERKATEDDHFNIAMLIDKAYAQQEAW